MIFNQSKEELEIFRVVSETAQSMDIQVYLVGGYVRDLVLGRPSKDIDIVCVGSGVDLAERIANTMRPRPLISVFRRFGTAMLKYGDWEVEFVGARRESYTADSRNPAVEDGTLDDDLNRRDFTINAMAISLNADNYGEIIDTFAGLQDLSKKLIRTPLEPGKTYSDDPLRMMRAIRFASQLGFEIEKSSMEGITHYKDRIHIISKERIADELHKIVLSKQPSKGFKLLFDTGLLQLILPELSDLQGVEERNGLSHKDNFYHTLEVLDNISQHTNLLWLRWSAIFHDIAKPPTKRFDPQVGWTFHGHEALGASWIPRIFKRMKFPLDAKMKYVQALVRMHLRPISLTKEEITDSAVRRLIFEAGEDLDDLLTLCRADITSKNEHKVNRYLENYNKLEEKIRAVEEKDGLRNWQPPITGEIIMEVFGLKPSKEVGDIKTQVREAILDGIIPNDYDEAFKYMIKMGCDIGLSPLDKTS